MANLQALVGDGVNFAFFDLLWSKCSSNERSTQSPILRVPDSVLFLFGLPHQWYFTSKNGGPHKDKTTILRKRKANLTLHNIEEVFLTKASSRGEVGDDEVVAYFISSKTDENGDGGLNACLDVYNAVVDNNMACSIEYFDKKSLREFLHHGRHNKSGILQRFIAPHGGTHNSCIRAAWTPNMCLLDRRRTKQSLHDKRYALYERAITFDGPDVHSVSLPLRGSVLAGRVEKICDEIVKHITNITAGTSKGNSGVGRMALNFKVDGNGKIWLLWSDSIRLESKTHGISTANEAASISQPLNMNTVVKLPSAVRLTQNPSHDTSLKLENKLSSAICPSCGRCDTNENFQKVHYKTVISHFDKTIDMLQSTPESNPSKIWPPEARFIKAAGNVGFGTASKQDAPIEKLVIPPVLRQCHPKLQVKGYKMYRSDPLFLQKTCEVCEDCFLAYAKLKESSFLMVPPANLPRDGFQEIAKNKISNDRKSKVVLAGKKSTEVVTTVDKFDFKDFGRAPELPPAILSPPQSASSMLDSNESKNVPIQHPTIEQTSLPDCSGDDDLRFMIDLNNKLASAHPKPKRLSNPYAEDLTLEKL